jgi:hypothetical protein
MVINPTPMTKRGSGIAVLLEIGTSSISKRYEFIGFHWPNGAHVTPLQSHIDFWQVASEENQQQ